MATIQQRAIELLMVAALERILADKNLKGDQYSQLKKACQLVLAGRQQSAVADNSQPEEATNSGIDQYLLPLHLACRSKSTTIARTALDCLQALIANKGMTFESLTMDRIVEMICACAIDLKKDEHVQNQVAIALLTALSGPHRLMSKITVFLALRILNLTSRTMNEGVIASTLAKVVAITQQSVFGVASQVRDLVNQIRQQQTTPFSVKSKI